MGLRKRFRAFRNWCPQPSASPRLKGSLDAPGKRGVHRYFWYIVASVIAAVLVAGLVSYALSQAAISNSPQNNAQQTVNIYAIDPTTAYHILANGNITAPQGLPIGANPSVLPISRNGSTYTITGNIEFELIVEKSNIVLDGSGLPKSNPNAVGSYPNSLCLILSNVQNVTVTNLITYPAYSSIYFNGTSNSKLLNSSSNQLSFNNAKNNIISNCSILYDILFSGSSNNTIMSCSAGHFEFDNSNNNRLIYNQFTNEDSQRIWLSDSSGNLIFGNSFGPCFRWIVMFGSSTHNLIEANNVTTGNFIMDDYLTGSNTFYHNNFQNLAWNSSETSNSANTWSINGQGNYWSNYNGTGTNGVGSTPFIIDATNRDDYPLLAPVNIAQEQIPSGYLAGGE